MTEKKPIKRNPLLWVIIALVLFATAETAINMYGNYDDSLHGYGEESIENSAGSSTPSTSNDSTPTSTENSLTVQEKEIYDYIQEQFDIITNNGDYYDPEVHDPIVMKRASGYFGMSIEEVDKIYMSASMKIGGLNP